MKRAAVIVSLVIGAGTLSSGYVLNSPGWATRQVTYYINPVNSDVSQSAAIAAIQSAASAWSLQSTADIQLYYGGTTTGSSLVNNGKNEVFFRNASNGSLFGSTYWWYDSSGHIIDADTVFYDASIHFYTGTSGCTGSYATYIEDAATHELGHILGLKHSTDTTATMYPTMVWCAQSWRTLAPDDQAGIEALYPASSTTSTPTAPASLAASAKSSTQVGLTWSDRSSNETGFAVERSADNVTYGTIGQVGTNATSYTDGTVAASKTYYYRVRAFNSAGSSGYSNVASVTTPAAAATTSTAISLRASGYKLAGVRYANLSWSGATGTSVDVYRNGSKIAATANDGAYTDTIGGKGKGTFSYAVCLAGTSTCSNTASVTF